MGETNKRTAKDLKKLSMKELDEIRAGLAIPFAVGRTKRDLVELIVEAESPATSADFEDPPVDPDDGGPPVEPGKDGPPANGRKQQKLTAVKARPELCPRCGSPRRTILQSVRKPKEGDWFDGRWHVGIVHRRCECGKCANRYRVTDVIRDGGGEPVKKLRPRVEILAPDA